MYAVVVAIASEMYTGTVPYFKTAALTIYKNNITCYDTTGSKPMIPYCPQWTGRGMSVSAQEVPVACRWRADAGVDISGVHRN